MHELIINLHMHTRYSDGHGTHSEIAAAAMRAGIDAVIVTDHNVLVQGPEDYYQEDDRRVLMLIGEEIHDQARDPQKNHLLVFGINREMAQLAPDPQDLIHSVRSAGGLSFLAHPFDPAAPAIGEPDISWVDWEVRGYDGIELWNAMSEFKSRLRTKIHAIYYAFNPRRANRGPLPETLHKWDELLASGRKVVAIGGSDAHAFPARMGPLRRTIFPYEYHFRTVNTHVLVPRPLGNNVEEDRRMILEALGAGRAFIGYDLPHPTCGFRFGAQGKDKIAFMGDDISTQFGVTLQIRLPVAAECRLLKDGEVVNTWTKRENCTHITSEPGVYRVEVSIHDAGQERGWIFSNPIYLKN